MILLTDRQQEVLALVRRGLSNKEIGEILFVSVYCIKSHLYNIYRILGAKNRISAINLYYTFHLERESWDSYDS